MKTFTEFTEARNSRASKKSKAYEWAVDQIENSDKDIDQIRKEFARKFGKAHNGDLEQAIDDVAGY